MRVHEVMTSPVVTVSERAPFKEIVAVMIDHHISGVPVVDPDGRAIGIVTEADLVAKEAYAGGAPRSPLRAVAGGLTARHRDELRAQARCAFELMTPHLVVAEPGETVRVAARRMLEHRVKRLVVLDDGKPVGVVSRRDVIRVLGGSDTVLKEALDAFLVRAGYGEPDHHIVTRVEGGIVTLEGSVFYERDIRAVGGMVDGFDGVVAVENWLLYRFEDPGRRVSSQRG